MKDRTPYTYFLLHKPTGLKYYGSKYERDADPALFWKPGGYFSSSDKVKSLILEYGAETFRAEVRKIFSTPDDAIEYEYKFLEKVGALKKADWLNENAGGKKFRNVGPMSERALAKQRAKKQTPEGNAKRSATLKGRPKTELTKQKMVLAQANRPIEKELERRKKIRDKAIGRGHTKATCAVIAAAVKGTIWIKKNGECKKIKEHELAVYVQDGWQRGRIIATLKCPNCHREMGASNAKRYHFNNCKEK